MKVTEYFEAAQGRTLISFEILPPLKGGSMKTIFDTLDPLMSFKPPFIDVTYHREEYIYKKQESGFYEKCGGFTKEDTENALIDLNFLNVRNVLALRGDADKFDGRFIPKPGGHHYALDLVKQIKGMNEGIYLDENIDKGEKTDFCIGVAGYPEKHFEAANMNIDLLFLKEKVEAGANYVVTQMFFDNQHFFNYVKACHDLGITIPIVPGLKPLTKKAQLSAIPRNFYINMPDDLVKAVMNAKDDKVVKEIGIEWCIQQSKELKAANVPCIHYYTMGDQDTIMRIANAVY